jgi:hypothetical protein
MTGSILAVIIPPIVVIPILGGWLTLLFYVGSHPLWREHTQPRGSQLDQAAPPSALAPPPGSEPPR